MSTSKAVGTNYCQISWVMW